MKQIDLNCDLGESFGLYQIGNDEEVLKHISSANIACGYHAGDHNVMMNTVKLAKAYNVGIGAHPGLPDLAGFGRREMDITPNEIYNLVIYQIGALSAVATSLGTSIKHVKPHGALYNMGAKNVKIATAIAQAIYDVNPMLMLFGLSGSFLTKVGQEIGLKVVNEVFADRTYQPDGTLMPRTEPNAMIHDSDVAVQRVIRMAQEGKVTASNGEDISIQADTICVHGDEPQALEFVKKLKSKLELENIKIKSY